LGDSPVVFCEHADVLSCFSKTGNLLIIYVNINCSRNTPCYGSNYEVHTKKGIPGKTNSKFYCHLQNLKGKQPVLENKELELYWNQPVIMDSEQWTVRY
jgi:hypothetical protein